VQKYFPLRLEVQSPFWKFIKSQCFGLKLFCKSGTFFSANEMFSDWGWIEIKGKNHYVLQCSSTLYIETSSLFSVSTEHRNAYIPFWHEIKNKLFRLGDPALSFATFHEQPSPLPRYCEIGYIDRGSPIFQISSSTLLLLTSAIHHELTVRSSSSASLRQSANSLACRTLFRP
jgi:hypothetical protein